MKDNENVEANRDEKKLLVILQITVYFLIIIELNMKQASNIQVKLSVGVISRDRAKCFLLALYNLSWPFDDRTGRAHVNVSVLSLTNAVNLPCVEVACFAI